jgi:hypothetical protein
MCDLCETAGTTRPSLLTLRSILIRVYWCAFVVCFVRCSFGWAVFGSE